MSITRQLITLLISLTLLACIGCVSKQPTTLVMTYNIRIQTPKDGPNQWIHRRDPMAQMINARKPDLIGFQEVKPEQLKDLAERLAGYAWVGIGRNGGNDGEFAPVFYQTGRFELLDSGTFWLAPDTTKPGLGWDALYPRIATWAKLRDRKTERVVVMLNTHLDHAGEVARLESAKLISRRLYELAGKGPAIVTADMNAAPKTPQYNALVNAGLRDTRLAGWRGHSGPYTTYTGWPGSGEEPSLLDFVFVTRQTRVFRAETLDSTFDGRPLSDHRAVIAEIE